MRLSIGFIFISILMSLSLDGQTKEEVQKFIDTLDLGGSYLIGKQFQEFNGISMTGKEYSDKCLKEKITVVNFWYEDCQPCMAEVDALNDLFSRFRSNKKFQFLSITFYPKEKVRKFVARHHIKYPVILFPEAVCSALNFRKGFPSTIITNNSGNIIFYSIGGSLDPELAKKRIQTDIYPILEQQLGNK